MAERHTRARQLFALAEEGSAIVEAALLTPMVFVLVLGILDGGRAIWLYNTIAQGAAAGTRFAAVRGDTPGNPLGGATEDDVAAYVKALPGLDGPSVHVVPNWSDPTRRLAGTTVTVTVTVDFSSALTYPIPISLQLKSTSKTVVAY